MSGEEMSLRAMLIADLEALFDQGGLTVPVSYIPAHGLGQQLKGIYEEAWCEVDVKTKAPISSTMPAVHMQTGQLPAEPADGDRLVIDGRTFRMLAPKPNGYGLTVYPLKEVRP